MPDQVDLKALPTPEQRKKAFQDYMQAHGVISSINHAVVAMYDQGLLPDRPQLFLANHLAPHLQARIDELEAELDNTKAELSVIQAAKGGS